MRLSVEIVPRTLGDLEGQLAQLAELAPQLEAAGLDTVNVPSAPRYSLDPIDACTRVAAYGWHGVPHLRSMDLPEAEYAQLLRRLEACDIREVLVVAGDPPKDGAPRAPTSTPCRLLQALSAARPALRCYAAFDPNRPPDADTLAGIDAKLDAGAAGLFGQPAFDAQAMIRWQRALDGRLPAERIFWGAAPVLSERAKAWWERTNGIAFPDGFQATIEDWRHRLPRIAGAARALGGNLYVMPIRTPVQEALVPLLSTPRPSTRTARNASPHDYARSA